MGDARICTCAAREGGRLPMHVTIKTGVRSTESARPFRPFWGLARSWRQPGRT